MWAEADSPYGRWTAFLDMWSTGHIADPAVLPALQPEDLPADSWQRLVARVLNAIEARTAIWVNALVAAMGAVRDEFEAARALAQARHGLVAIRGLAEHPGLPSDIRERLRAIVDGKIRAAQRILEEQATDAGRTPSTRSAAGARLRTLRDNPLTAVLSESPPQADAWSAGAGSSRRRVIID